MPYRSRSWQARIQALGGWWGRTLAATETAGARDAEEPLRGELFSAAQMAAHGSRLAASHVLATVSSPDRLLARLADNERDLVGFGKRMAAAGRAERRFTPAAEWLLDNFYLIEEEVRTARRHLPRGYSRELPQLASDSANGSGAGLPRVYDLATQLVAHGDGLIERGPLTAFIAAYQTLQPLRLGELWACPIMLRLALIENLRRIAAAVAKAQAERDTAGRWADRMLEVAENRPSQLILVVADMARSAPTLSNAFVAEFARRLQGQGAGLALPLTWVEQRLAESGLTIAHGLQLEGQRQAANQVSVSNSIGSLRLLGALDWREFVEQLSGVEQALRGDPGGVYGLMDFSTRDRYRQAVEAIARLGTGSETAVAQQAVALSAAAVPGTLQSHVGYFLSGVGRVTLELALGARPPKAVVVQRWARARAVPLYAGAIGAITAALAAAALFELDAQLHAPWPLLAALAPVLLLVASQFAVAAVNWLVTSRVAPQPLPRLDYSDGIAAESRTLVVVPTMLGSAAGIEALVDALEVRFLANRDPLLHFGLLTDLHDARQQQMPEDAALLELASTRIAALNMKYGMASRRERADAFFLFHRPRRWNVRERIWMGHERKRGKLVDLNALLRGHASAGPSERFERIVGDTRMLGAVRYVITLDTDTQLPRDAALQLVATMAHPLNRPRFGTGAQENVVVGGYGILQPRVAASLTSTFRSGYARMYGGEPGIDPYTRAVSDVYQDLFGEGSYIGKGICDVDACERALSARLPENRILSHDLLEGCYARCGLLSEVLLLDEAPACYSADVARRYRWIRGDWQLLGWLRARLHLLPTAPPNPLSLIARAKIFDNLRRSLAPGALLLMLLVGWWLLPAPGRWTLYAVASVALVPLAALLMRWLQRLLQRLRGQSGTGPTAPQGLQALQALAHLLQTMACLPYEAAYSLSAVLRTLWRVLLSKRKLLEWRPSDLVSVSTRPGSAADLLHTTRTMAIGPLLALGCGAALALQRPAALAVAAPLLLLWLLSPLGVWWLDRPLQPRPVALGAAQRRFLRRLARRTWAFFDRHVGAADNHLPPDNMQEEPVARIAHRTSPTNMGFALLANLTAHGFGYIGSSELLQRLDAALATMQRMERHHGHFFNWYDTETLQPLHPHYVSTVDSGNLAAQLLTLRSGLLALADQAPLAGGWCEGVLDSLGVLQEALQQCPRSDAALPALLQQLGRSLSAHQATPPDTPQAWHTLLDELEAAAVAILMRVDGGTAGPAADADADADADAVVDALADADAAAYAVVDALVDALMDSGPEHAGASEDETLFWARQLLRHCRGGRDELRALAPLPAPPGDWSRGMPSLRELAGQPDGGQLARQRLQTICELAERAEALAEMEQEFLYDPARRLLTIGYNVEERRADSGAYDLLASEARLGVFVAIAQGQIGQDSWFALGRLLTSAAGTPVLLSWSGSMFEYLMPMLLMPSYPDTLLERTCQGAVQRQIEYGAERGVPWGISESGYNATDVNLNYQYRAFGVPGLGLKRGLAEDLVVAPYASMMALMVAPDAACANLQRLAAAGAAGRFGLYEAIDYTATRIPHGQKSAVVRSFMAHHQGMGLLALAYLLLERPMQRCFEADPRLQATLLLLQERAPGAAALQPDIDARAGVPESPQAEEALLRVINSADTPTPEVQLLSNGRYHVMVTNAGGGYSRWQDLAVTRWREDSSGDGWGSFCYLRDVTSGAVWSAAHQPVRRAGTHYEAIFTQGRAEFRRRDDGIETHSEIAVSPEDDIELRRLRITNNGPLSRTLEVTSYTEVVLAPAAADAMHPAFSKLFVQTEIVERPAAILCTRRPRSPHEPAPCMFQLMAVHGPRAATGGPNPPRNTAKISHETDRARFIGRGNDLQNPLAMQEPGPLSNSAGSVLDPVAASRCRIVLAPDQTIIVDIVLGMADNRRECLALAEKYQDRRLADRVFELAWTHAQVVMHQLNASRAEALLFGRLAGAVIYPQTTWRAASAVLLRNRRSQSALWRYAISGDLPIVLLHIGNTDNIDLVRQLVRAHAWWRSKGLLVDLVIWNEERDVYRQRLQEQILGLIAAGIDTHLIDRPGGIFVRPVEQIAPEDRILLQSVARAVFADDRGSLAEQMQRRPQRERRIAAAAPPRAIERRALPFAATRSGLSRSHGLAGRGQAAALASAALANAVRPELGMDNGIGGFSADAREYVIAPPSGVRPPAPWVNVLANPRFGSVVSEAGSAYTWCENAHELRLTPWHNDPVCDSSGEAIYLRDEESGEVWSPTSLPCAPEPGVGARFTTRHGFGYSVFEHQAYGVRSELTVFVAIDAPVKFSRLRLTNLSGRPRLISATGYVEWVLGDLGAKSAPHLVTELAPGGTALTARNPYSTDYADCVGFFDTDIDDSQRAASSFTCDRTEFIGRNGSMRNPAALARARLSGRSGAALDPCAAIQLPIRLQDGQTDEIVFRLGLGRSAGEAATLIARWRGAAAATLALQAVQRHWQQTLGTLQVDTPDPALNALANGWLLYQTIACRLWARSGYYQSGGAFGFRDQLQDTMALVHSQPQMLGEQLLLCASRQFVEGDVQHWWHPPQGRGVRTHISDDYLWLPLALARYVETTGDLALLERSVPFLEGRTLDPHDDSCYDLPSPSEASASLYEHARRALWHGLRFGEHGLPLMGGGDWNDGMNLVGHGGRGESVWLGFFLCEVLQRFGELALRLDDGATAQRCRIERERLGERLETDGWDGAWYRRAYFDDGAALGSAANAECRIDSIAQSWSVLSGIASPQRGALAMESMHQKLVDEQSRLVLLLAPPFNKQGPNPGYIAGYVPGVRENGGQYTHGAIWAAMAFAALGQNERAWSLFALINPLRHSATPEGMARYKVEPYVMAADVYGVAPHTGRGGWTWYTGSAGWMYRLIVESLLGLRLVSTSAGAQLVIQPCLPAHWPACRIGYRYRETPYAIEIIQGAADGADTAMFLDGTLLRGNSVPLIDDRLAHQVRVQLRVTASGSGAA